MQFRGSNHTSLFILLQFVTFLSVTKKKSCLGAFVLLNFFYRFFFISLCRKSFNCFVQSVHKDLLKSDLIETVLPPCGPEEKWGKKS